MGSPLKYSVSLLVQEDSSSHIISIPSLHWILGARTELGGIFCLSASRVFSVLQKFPGKHPSKQGYLFFLWHHLDLFVFTFLLSGFRYLFEEGWLAAPVLLAASPSLGTHCQSPCRLFYLAKSSQKIISRKYDMLVLQSNQKIVISFSLSSFCYILDFSAKNVLTI